MPSGHPSAVQNHRNLRPLEYIGRAGHDLGSPGSDIHLADHQLIRIRVFLDLFNPADHDFIQICIQFLITFHLGTGQRHRVRIFLRGHIQVRHICFYP